MNDIIPIKIIRVDPQEHSDGGNTVSFKLSSVPTIAWRKQFYMNLNQELDNMRGSISLENDNLIIKDYSRNQLESLKKEMDNFVNTTNNMYELMQYSENQ